MNHPPSIRAVHQKLLLRLILMGGAIALLLGAAVWIFQHDRIDTEIIDRATHSVRLMNEEVRFYLRESGGPDIAGLQRQLEAFSAHVLHSRSGRFVAVRIYSADHKLLAAVTDPAYPLLEGRKAFPRGDDVSADKLESMHIKSDRFAGNCSAALFPNATTARICTTTGSRSSPSTWHRVAACRLRKCMV